MIAAAELNLVLVTPEKTLLDISVDSLQFPLEDGQIGILPNRAPMVGRLGCGELLVIDKGQEQRFFIDGGFSQVKGKTVSILTNRAIPADKITLADAQEALSKAEALPGETAEQSEHRTKELQRARQMLALVSR